MKPFQNVLVPVDFSPLSDEAVEVAADLTRRYAGRLTLAHVYQAVAYPVLEGAVLYTPQQLSALLNEAEAQLERARQVALKSDIGSVETKLLQGDPVNELAAFARTMKADLVVMATHGRRGLDHAIMGSVAERTMRKLPCPVLLVRPLAH